MTGKEAYRAYVRRALRGRGLSREKLEALVDDVLAGRFRTRESNYDYYDQRWVTADQPHSPIELRLRLWHGASIANRFLVLLLAFDLTDWQRHFWQSLLANWVDCLVQMKGRAGRRELRVSPRLYLAEAWDGPYEGHEVESMDTDVRDAGELLGAGAVRNGKSVEEVTREVREWHQEVAGRLAAGRDVKGCVHRL